MWEIEKYDFKTFFLSFSAYEFAQSIQELEDCIGVPDINCFQNSLTGDTISVEEYNETKKIYNQLGFMNLREYMESYCMIDVYLLAEIFFAFRKECLVHFSIDPNNYISLPGLSYDCFLKSTNIVLDPVWSGK